MATSKIYYSVFQYGSTFVIKEEKTKVQSAFKFLAFLQKAVEANYRDTTVSTLNTGKSFHAILTEIVDGYNLKTDQSLCSRIWRAVYSIFYPRVEEVAGKVEHSLASTDSLLRKDLRFFINILSSLPQKDALAVFESCDEYPKGSTPFYLGSEGQALEISSDAPLTYLIEACQKLQWYFDKIRNKAYNPFENSFTYLRSSQDFRQSLEKFDTIFLELAKFYYQKDDLEQCSKLLFQRSYFETVDSPFIQGLVDKSLEKKEFASAIRALHSISSKDRQTNYKKIFSSLPPMDDKLFDSIFPVVNAVDDFSLRDEMLLDLMERCVNATKFEKALIVSEKLFLNEKREALLERIVLFDIEKKDYDHARSVAECMDVDTTRGRERHDKLISKIDIRK